MTPTVSDFLAAMERRLRERGVSFSQAALRSFVESMWPWVMDDPDADHWAGRFSETGPAATVPD